MFTALFPPPSKSDRQRAWQRTPEGRIATRRWCFLYRLKKLGLTEDQYNELLRKQKGVCAVCKTRKPWNKGGSDQLCVDHCHKTGKIRGLLCGRCNKVLGAVKDSPKLLKALADYLRAA
jgi:hypothetical protein